MYIRQNCPDQKEASIVYGCCSTDYFTMSPINTSFPTLLLCDPTDNAADDPFLWNLQLENLFNNLSSYVASDESKFAVGNISVGSDYNIYMVWCSAFEDSEMEVASLACNSFSITLNSVI
ncbi:hypothetical protein FEM48_Zijuj04G0085100 [Ziziphus jujuba var. spinosa]|uniref:Uncharacterized protein n=1 Tax=Ziziphus jujuba var. spinosa TaxID=714518 RepID=A0A978VIU9_ZIZJJ|nr:hypothetical protein FEM48_Zijuj04G0085100 [Ziziphus jujuba var. spinosa]